MTSSTPLAPHLAEPTRIGDEISITGKWVPSKPGGRFRTSEESREMLQEWEDIHQGARADNGVLSTEINHAVGEDAVLVHHVFENADALTHYFATPAAEHTSALTAVAKPDLHMVRGRTIPDGVDSGNGGSAGGNQLGPDGQPPNRYPRQAFPLGPTPRRRST